MSLINQTEIIEKREYPRYHLPLRLYINKRKDRYEEQCDIGEGGLSFQSSLLFKEDDFILFHLAGNANSKLNSIKFSILGRIVWFDKTKDDTIKYGAQFKFYNDPFSTQQRSIMTSTINQFSS